MLKDRAIRLISLFLFSSLLFLSNAVGQEDKNDAAKNNSSLNAVEFLVGFGHADLTRQGKYQVGTLFVDLDYDLKKVFPEKFVNYPGLLQFVWEPFVSGVWQPDNNAEVGNNFLIKAGILSEDKKLQPYIKAGVGLIYMTQHTREEGTQLNFNEYAGLGVHYFFKKNLAFTIEYRFRHLSNADIKAPNRGINTNFAVCGVTYKF